MAIPFWDAWSCELRRERLKLTIAGVAVGAGCLYVGTRTPSYPVVTDEPASRSRQAIEQVSYELAADVEPTPLPGGAQVLLRTAPASRVVPAVALVGAASGGTEDLRRVELAAYGAEGTTGPREGLSRSPASRPAASTGPVRLTGRIEVIP